MGIFNFWANCTQRRYLENWRVGESYSSRSRTGFSLLSTSMFCRLISSRIIDKAVLQDSSSLKAKVHLPSTRDFILVSLGVPDLGASKKGNVDGRIRKCSHLACLSSILGWKILKTKRMNDMVFYLNIQILNNQKLDYFGLWVSQLSSLVDAFLS